MDDICNLSNVRGKGYESMGKRISVWAWAQAKMQQHPTWKENKAEKDWIIAQLLEHLPNKRVALSSKLYTMKELSIAWFHLYVISEINKSTEIKMQ
jgi:hypothetical protein